MIEALFSDVETTVSGSLARDTDFCHVDDVLRFRFSKKKTLAETRKKKSLVNRQRREKTQEKIGKIHWKERNISFDQRVLSLPPNCASLLSPTPIC